MNNHHLEPQRKLSPWRVLLAIFILFAIGVGSVFAMKNWDTIVPVASSKESWFGAYVDVTAKPTYSFEQISNDQGKIVVLSFIVSSHKDPCVPTWGNAYTLEEAGAGLDLDRRIARYRQQGGNVAVSFGGLINDELAVKCTDEAKLKQAYKAVIDRYNLDTIDLDLELGGLTDNIAAERRAKVLSELQQDIRSQGKSLAIWITLPVIPQGLTDDGTNAIAALLRSKVDLAGVNIMTMNYGESRQGNSMQVGSEDALKQTHRQLGIIYEQTGTHLSNATLWSKLGATPMIGQNDIRDEVFSLDDARGLNEFAKSKKLGRMSMWSANRDTTCGSNYTEIKIVSDSCSGVKQEKFEFAQVLGRGFGGDLSENAGVVTSSEEKIEIPKDDPASSPYPIWSETGTYLQGTKVVWHQNVYKAKWWTRGDLPDNPVLQAWQTPWELIGPVLPGEKPISQATIPEGTYSNWSGDASYEKAARVMFEGVPFEAKWWNKGESPAAAASNPDSSPWVPLTQQQINDVKAKQN